MLLRNYCRSLQAVVQCPRLMRSSRCPIVGYSRSQRSITMPLSCPAPYMSVKRACTITNRWKVEETKCNQTDTQARQRNKRSRHLSKIATSTQPTQRLTQGQHICRISAIALATNQPARVTPSSRGSGLEHYPTMEDFDVTVQKALALNGTSV